MKRALARRDEGETRDWVIAGETVSILMPTSKKAKRMGDEELRAWAYKQRILELVRKLDMLGALKALREMQDSDMEVDIQILQIIASGVSGEYLEQTPGESGHMCKLSGSKAVGAVDGSPRGEMSNFDEQGQGSSISGAAQDSHLSSDRNAFKNPVVAAEAAMDLYTKYVKNDAKRGSQVPESVYTNVVRALCMNNRVDDALAIVEDLKASKHKPRLRTFAAPLAALGRLGKIDQAIKVWKDALNQNLQPLEPEYLSLIQACTARPGDYAIFREVMLSYADDVLRPGDLHSWDVLKNWFAAAKEAWTVQDAQVDELGTCSSCQRRLLSIEVDEKTMTELSSQVEKCATSSKERKAQWSHFNEWLAAANVKSPFDVVIDGANVGYFKRVYSQSATADLQQINWAVEHYEAQGKRPLVILHSRHMQRRVLSSKGAAILAGWRRKNIIYSVEPKNNDDWYWMWAAIKLGGRVLVLTNDEMRDHHFLMLSHRSFLRWKERHQVRFTFEEWNAGARRIDLQEPSVYSKRSQCFPAGENCDVWHIPLEGSSSWLCARNHS